MKAIRETLHDFLTSIGLESSTADFVNKLIILLVIIALAFLAQRICKKLILPVIQKVIKSTKATWDDIIFDKKVIGGLAGLIAPVLIYVLTPLAYEAGSEGLILVQRLCMVYIIAVFVRFISALLSAFYSVYSAKEKFKDRPLKGLLQTVQIALYFVAGIAIVSILIDKSPAILLTGLGASAAILMLVFQDSILGFVSGIQLSANDMLRVGDWIEMPKYGVDGDVIEVTLNTVKVQNFDRTIVTIPPTLLMKDSFKNWRGMVDAGGRRVKRSIYIDMNSVHFCTHEMLERYNKIQVVSEYIEDKEKMLNEYNKEHNIDDSIVVNGRRQTNLGIFRAYLDNYLKNHPSVHQGMTCMVRQLQPTDKGLPLELYFFTNTTAWIAYENIQSDIFDHVLAVIPYFDLHVYQAPSGNDFEKMVRTN
ncbi:mechanosensitive ion channel family protein [Bacteroides sp. 519]|uniref:mechanosensitive ion channel family protein n=1 Tax=Bacteroides sp. 519 TaxID=2302937 RepID=UPI0013D6D51F|nr:mechanosensitive ion channel domain-containing protein [Bacteroides sp. 519]NDV56509.1 mechanosensitive ion channel family protein [Bacteroides sp. 519]